RRLRRSTSSSMIRMRIALLKRDLHLRQVIPVLRNMCLERRPVAAARPVLNLLAEDRDVREAIGIADALHAVPKLAQLLEVGRRQRELEGLQLLVAVAHESRDQV